MVFVTTSLTFNLHMKITVVPLFFAFATFPSIQMLLKLFLTFFLTFLAIGFLQLLTSSYSLSPDSRSLEIILLLFQMVQVAVHHFLCLCRVANLQQNCLTKCNFSPTFSTLLPRLFPCV